MRLGGKDKTFRRGSFEFLPQRYHRCPFPPAYPRDGARGAGAGGKAESKGPKMRTAIWLCIGAGLTCFLTVGTLPHSQTVRREQARLFETFLGVLRGEFTLNCKCFDFCHSGGCAGGDNNCGEYLKQAAANNQPPDAIRGQWCWFGRDTGDDQNVAYKCIYALITKGCVPGQTPSTCNPAKGDVNCTCDTDPTQDPPKWFCKVGAPNPPIKGASTCHDSSGDYPK